MIIDLCASDKWGSYPDVIQAFGTVIAVPLTLVTLWKLVRRDEDRKTEIDRITKISEALTEIVKQQAQQDKIAKRPQIVVEINTKNSNTVEFEFKNSNYVSNIVSIEANCNEEDSIMQSTINTSNGAQYFSVELSFEKRLELHNFDIIYTTEEGYRYIQEIKLWKNDQHSISPVHDYDKIMNERRR